MAAAEKSTENDSIFEWSPWTTAKLFAGRTLRTVWSNSGTLPGAPFVKSDNCAIEEHWEVFLLPPPLLWFMWTHPADKYVATQNPTAIGPNRRTNEWNHRRQSHEQPGTRNSIPSPRKCYEFESIFFYVSIHAGDELQKQIIRNQTKRNSDDWKELELAEWDDFIL